MSLLQVRDMDSSTEYFVATCSHVNESDEMDASAARRLDWLQGKHQAGLRVKVATLDGTPAGFLYVMPIEISPSGPHGRDLMVIPCLAVPERAKGNGVGRTLLAAAEEECRLQRRKGIVTIGFYHDFWFMPATFFDKQGYSVAERRGDTAILWKVFDKSAEVPSLLTRRFQYEPISGKVVVDLFWFTFCMTVDMEAQRVREVVAEFGTSVVLREYSADDQAILRNYQTPRGIFVNGREIGWGYEAPKEGIREAISLALQEIRTG